MRNRNIYPVMPIFRRNRSGGGGGGGGDPTQNEQNIAEEISVSIEGMSESLAMLTPGMTGPYYNKNVEIRPERILYLEDGSLTNRALYCIYSYTFPAGILAGDCIASLDTSNFSYGVDFSVGSGIPHVTGKIGIYKKPAGPLTFQIVEESAGQVIYANFDASLIEDRDYQILFPAHIPGAVLCGMLPESNYGMAYGGVIREIESMLSRIPAAIAPYAFAYDDHPDNKTAAGFGLSPKYGAGKQIVVKNLQSISQYLPTVV